MYNDRVCLKNQEEDNFKRVKLLLCFIVRNLACKLSSSMQFFDISVLKGIVHTKISIVIFTHSHVIPNLHDRLSSAEHKRHYFE